MEGYMRKVVVFFLILLISTSFAYASIPTDGLVFHLTFDNCKVEDETGHVTEFFINGNPQCVDGVKGKAFYFDGDDWIGADTFFPIGKGTLIVFVKPDRLIYDGEHMTILDSKTNFRSLFSFISSPNGPVIRIGYPSAPFYDDYQGRWLMLAFVYYDGKTSHGKRIAYLNGVKVGEQIWPVNEYTISWYGSPDTYDLNIGVTDHLDRFLKDAAVDEIMFYNRPLSPREIQQIYENITGQKTKLIYSDRLLAYYSFDNCDAHDDSGNGHTGTIQGALDCVPGVKGMAVYFDGKDWVDLPDFFVDYPYVSVCAWIKKEETSGHQSIIDGWKNVETFHLSWRDGLTWCGNTKKAFVGYGFGVHPGHPGSDYDPEKHICGSFNPLNKWVFVCGTFDGQTLKLYENAKLVAQYDYPDNERFLNYSDRYLWHRPGPDIRLGVNRYNTNPFKGYLDELYIYNYNLTESEIKSLYNSFGYDINEHPLIKRLTYDQKIFFSPIDHKASVRFVCEASDPDGDDLTFIWRFKNLNDNSLDEEIKNTGKIFYHFDDLADYEVSCTVIDSKGGKDNKKINFSLSKFLIENTAPILFFSKRGDKASLKSELLQSLLEVSFEVVYNMIPREDYKIMLLLIKEGFVEKIPEYETFFPTSINNFLNHLDSSGCLDKNYVNLVRGDINLQKPLTVYYYIIEKPDRIILEYWFFYLYNDFPLDYHQGDWEGLFFVLDKDSWTIKKGVFYQHHTYESLERDRIGSVLADYPDNPPVFVSLGTHASYGYSDANYPLDRHTGDYIILCPNSAFDVSYCSDSYQLVDMNRIKDKLQQVYQWGCNRGIALKGDVILGKSPLSPIFQGEKFTDPEVWIAKKKDEFSDPHIKEFKFYSIDNGLMLEIVAQNKGKEGIGYLSLDIEDPSLSCDDISIVDNKDNVKCYNPGDMLYCDYGRDMCHIKYPHIEYVINPAQKNRDYTLKIRLNKLKKDKTFVMFKFLVSDKSETNWTYTGSLNAGVLDVNLPVCLVLDQQKEHSWRTFIFSDGNFYRYMNASYSCYGQVFGNPNSFDKIINLTPLFAPIPIFPKGEISLNKDYYGFSWNGATGARNYYHIQLARDASFSDVLYEARDITTAYVNVSAEDLYLQAGTYYWRVRAVNECGESEWSEPASFSIPAVEPKITITVPKGRATLTVGETVEIRWTYQGDVGETVKIRYNTGGRRWYTIATGVPMTEGSYFWTVPNKPTSRLRIKIESEQKRRINDTAGYFTITE